MEAARESIVLLKNVPVNEIPLLPIRQLKAFQWIHLKNGEKRSVNVSIPIEDLALFDEKQECFVVDPGSYEILVGASSSDIRAQLALKIAN